MLFVGVDWAEAHHDVCAMDETGKVLGRKRIADSLTGLAELQVLLPSTQRSPTRWWSGSKRTAA
jgi:hypothetical protein